MAVLGAVPTPNVAGDARGLLVKPTPVVAMEGGAFVVLWRLAIAAKTGDGVLRVVLGEEATTGNVITGNQFPRQKHLFCEVVIAKEVLGSLLFGRKVPVPVAAGCQKQCCSPRPQKRRITVEK